MPEWEETTPQETAAACKTASDWLTTKGYPPVPDADATGKSCLALIGIIALMIVLPIAALIVGWGVFTWWVGAIAAIVLAVIEVFIFLWLITPKRD